jgi:hypothetical protein
MKYLILVSLLLSACASSSPEGDAVPDKDRAELRAYHIMRGHMGMRE